MIETSRLMLRPMVSDDVDPLLSVFGDPIVMRAFDTEPFDRLQMEQWVRRNLDHQQQHGYGLFTVILKDSNVVIGDCGLELMDVNGNHEAELGYDLRSDQWGQGFATEAASAVRDHAFADLDIPRLISLIRSGNHASRRVAEKIGMELEAELERYGTKYWRYAMAREAWRGRSSHQTKSG